MRAPSIGLILLLLCLPVPTSGQDPRPGVPIQPEAGLVRERLSAELVEPVTRSGVVRTPSGPWGCTRTLCSSRRVVSAETSVELCRQLRNRVGPIAAFQRGETALTPGELRSCNELLLDPPPGPVALDDGRAGRRLPPPDATSPVPAYGRAELRIRDVKRLGADRIRVAGVVPVEVLVENAGDVAATVALQVIDLSSGTARWSYTPAARIEAGETASWRVDLVATGSEPTGKALCGEHSGRVISLVESARPEAVPGYRPGTAEGAAWIPFRDRDDADNRRTVRFRFDCDVSFSPHPP